MGKIKLLTAALVALALLALPGSALAHKRDRDHDKMADRWEKRHGLSVTKDDSRRDRDRDGLSNLGEFRSRTSPRDPDTDGDLVEDGDEDRDRDRVDNANEIDEGTSPRDADSDDDGTRDGREDEDEDGLSNAAEDATGNDPDDPDTDGDGTGDGDERAGLIVSFADGVLTIDLANGGTVSGVVTDETEIGCKTEDEHEDEVEVESEDGDALGPAPLTLVSYKEAADDESVDEGRSGPNPGLDHDADDDGRDDDSADEEPGSEAEHEGDEDDRCSVADLVPGTRVHEAELELSAAGAVFEEVELVK